MDIKEIKQSTLQAGFAENLEELDWLTEDYIAEREKKEKISAEKE